MILTDARVLALRRFCSSGVESLSAPKGRHHKARGVSPELRRPTGALQSPQRGRHHIARGVSPELRRTGARRSPQRGRHHIARGREHRVEVRTGTPATSPAKPPTGRHHIARGVSPELRRWRPAKPPTGAASYSSGREPRVEVRTGTPTTSPAKPPTGAASYSSGREPRVGAALDRAANRASSKRTSESRRPVACPWFTSDPADFAPYGGSGGR